MIKDTITTGQAQRFYDAIGKRYDWFELYEARAKALAFELLELEPGQSLLNVGVGTGKQHHQIQDALHPGGHAFGLDLSPVMARLAHTRSGAPICQADVMDLPFANARLDRLFAAYLLDLIPVNKIPAILAGFWRVLAPGGRMVLLSLTEGINLPSRALVGLWKAAYALSPLACGGCRPLQLSSMAQAAGFELLRREVVVQMAVPSEILVACKPSV